jgi:hypothetical protein
MYKLTLTIGQKQVKNIQEVKITLKRKKKQLITKKKKTFILIFI